MKTEQLKRPDKEKEKQAGQTIILIALMMVALLGIVGLAVDVGFIFARNSQLSSAVDAAVLAGVTEVQALDPNTVIEANVKAGQFLRSNNIPQEVVDATFADPANFSVGTTIIGATEYRITVTWPIELYFLRLFRSEPVDLRRSAAAAYFPLVDIFTSDRVAEGIRGTSNNAVFGPSICTRWGDAFSPLTRDDIGTPNPFWPILQGTYNYRIMIPNDYPYDIVRIELFDPDSMNNVANPSGLVITRTQAAVNAGLPLTTTVNVGGTARNPAIRPTGEQALVDNGTLDRSQINPFWLWRLDENRGGGAGNGDGRCVAADPYQERFNTATLYELFYFRRNADGSVNRVELASYTGQTGDERDNWTNGLGVPGDHQTDLRWTSPGGSPNTVDQPALVPANCGSPTGGDFHPLRCPLGEEPGPGRGFEIRLTPDPDNPNRPWLQDVLIDEATGLRYIWLDVTALSGASENGYEIWAGPPIYTDVAPTDVNLRNLYALNNPGGHSSLGVTVFALGYLPMNSNTPAVWTDIPLIWVGPEYAGETISVSMFDSDAGSRPPIVFYFDSLAFDANTSGIGHNPNNTDYATIFGRAGIPDPDGRARNCLPGSCTNLWVTPAYAIRVPELNPEACNALPANDPERQYVCNPFYGGILIARYRAGEHDTYAWSITMPNMPYLIR